MIISHIPVASRVRQWSLLTCSGAQQNLTGFLSSHWAQNKPCRMPVWCWDAVFVLANTAVYTPLILNCASTFTLSCTEVETWVGESQAPSTVTKRLETREKCRATPHTRAALRNAGATVWEQRFDNLDATDPGDVTAKQLSSSQKLQPFSSTRSLCLVLYPNKANI